MIGKSDRWWYKTFNQCIIHVIRFTLRLSVSFFALFRVREILLLSGHLEKLGQGCLNFWCYFVLFLEINWWTWKGKYSVNGRAPKTWSWVTRDHHKLPGTPLIILCITFLTDFIFQKKQFNYTEFISKTLWSSVAPFVAFQTENPTVPPK